MPRNSTPIQSVRLYLIKDSIQRFEDALRPHANCVEFELDPVLGVDGKAFVRQIKSSELRWVRFLQSGLKDQLPDMKSSAHAAVVFLKVDKRILALVFGMGRYLLKDTSYEADFGIVAALNSVDPKGLRSADTYQFEAVAVHKKTQTSRTTTLSDFEIDTTREQIRSVTGKAKNSLLAARITGNEGAFGANLRVEFRDLADTCRKILINSQSNDYKNAFPHFDNLRRISDPQKVQSLESDLISKLITKNTTGIHMSPPEAIDYDDFSGFAFKNKDEVLDELRIEDYLDSLKDHSKLDLKTLKYHRVFLMKESVEEPLSRWSVFKSLICEFPDGNDICILMNGEWYQIANSFAQQVRDTVAAIKQVDVGLPSLGPCKTETDYLALIRNAGGPLIVLDQKRAYCENTGSYIEICDVLTESSDLVHIKRKKGGSSTLSHLFNQGQHSAFALLRDARYRNEARQHLSAFGKKTVARLPKNKPDPNDFRVVYGIMGTFKGTVAESLPFFSQLSLMFTYQQLAERGIEVCLTPIS